MLAVVFGNVFVYSRSRSSGIGHSHSVIVFGVDTIFGVIVVADVLS